MARYQNGTLELVKTAQGLCWYIRFTKDGKRPRIRVGLKAQYPTEAKASRAAQSIRDQQNSSSASPFPRRTFEDVIARYEAEEMPERYSTQRGYRQMHRLHIRPKWGKTLLEDMNAEQVRAWLLGLDLSSRTKGHLHGQMRLLFKFALFWKWSSGENPMSTFSIPGSTKRTRKPRVITPANFRALLAYFDRDLRMQTLICMAFCFGLRASELFALKWGDFDHFAGSFKISRAIVDGRVGGLKTERSDNPMPLGKVLGATLLKWRQATPFKEDDDWVFASAALNGLRPSNSQHIQFNALVKAGKSIGLDFPLGWHTFRHSCKVLLERTGADITVQRDYMRHSDTHTTTDVYGEVEFDRMQVAHEKAVDLAFREETRE